MKKPINDIYIAKKLINLQNSAASRSIEFDLSFKKAKQLILAKTCYYTGLKFDEGILDTSRTIDRVNSKIGYIDSNVVACTHKMNQKKGNLSIEDITILYKKINQHLNKHKS